jgi:hypothetical protein
MQVSQSSAGIAIAEQCLTPPCGFNGPKEGPRQQRRLPEGYRAEPRAFAETVFYWRDLHSGPNGATRDIIWCDPQMGQRGLYKKLVLDEKRLAGAVLVGDTRDALWYLELIRSGADVSSLRDSIIFGKAILERQAA